MNGYTKLFETILTSTIWAESNEIRLVWITMLALRNASNVVEASLPGLAHVARVSLEDTKKALEKLSSPDPYSRTKEHEGRRICEVDGGWLILNGAKYKLKLGKEERREYFRIKKAEHRALKQSQPLPGETDYCSALKRGASDAELDHIVDNAGRRKIDGVAGKGMIV
jgi:hypothetical protein